MRMSLGETEGLAVRESSSRSSSPLERISHEGGRAECSMGQQGERQCAMTSRDARHFCLVRIAERRGSYFRYRFGESVGETKLLIIAKFSEIK
jgi:hypothetical protein